MQLCCYCDILGSFFKGVAFLQFPSPFNMWFLINLHFYFKHGKFSLSSAICFRTLKQSQEFKSMSHYK